MAQANYSNCYIPLTVGLLSFWLWGYPTTTLSKPQPILLVQQPQFLPITAQARLANRTVNLEVARTPSQQAKGMMWRKEPLPDARGMLFIYNAPTPLAFWMKNCFVPLDMVFIANGRVVAIATAPPCTQDPCPIYPNPPVVGDAVIELRANWARDYGLKVGDRVEIKDLARGIQISPQ